jgi:hypothetical protein
MSCLQLVSHEAGPKETQNFSETDYRVTSKEKLTLNFFEIEFALS